MRAVIALAILLIFAAQVSAKAVIGVGESEERFIEHLYFKNARDVVHFLKVRRWTEEAKDDPLYGVRDANIAAHDPDACKVRDIEYTGSERQFYAVTLDGTFAVFRVKVIAEFHKETNMIHTGEDTAEYLYFPARE